MKIIGRDKLLEREVAPRVHGRKPFVLVGQRGIGKTVILEWAFKEYKKEKILLKSTNTYSYNLKEIAQVQGTKGSSNKKNTDLEIEIIKGKELAIFIDNIERATPKLITFLTSVNEKWKIFISGVEPFREELTRLMWGKKKIRILAIERKERAKLAEHVINKTGSMVNRNLISVESRGVPARAWAMARGEVQRDDAERVDGEEINIAPVLLVAVVAVVVMRYIGMGMGEKDLYILGGMGMGGALFMRYFIFQAMKK